MILVDLVSTQFYTEMKFHGGGEYVKAILFEILKEVTPQDVCFILKKKLGISEDILEKIKEYKIFYYEDGVENILKENNITKFYIGTIGNYNKINFPKELYIVVTIHDLRALEIVYDNLMFFYNMKMIHYMIGVIYRICKNNNRFISF